MLSKYIRVRECFGRSTPLPSAVNPSSAALDLSFLSADFKNFTSDEYSTMDTNGMCVPPLACSFAKKHQHQHIVGVVDEDGFLVLYNTRKTGSASVIKTWQAHRNAVFDLEWLKQEHKILTGSGDQTIVLHDVETSAKLDTFKGHASSVKSISCHTSSDAVFVSGSRDGHIMMWDMRVSRKDGVVPPVNTIYKAHMLQQQNTPQGKARKKSTSPLDAQQSVTAVLFQHENFVISAGAVDGCLKVWDTRKTYSKVNVRAAAPVHVFPYFGTNTRKRGYTSLVLDSRHSRLFASCTDDTIYEYDLASYNPKPVQSWRGHKNSTFYVKAALSPDDQFLLSGSSDEAAYIWPINKPNSSPVVLESHSAEVTSVAWCPNDLTKLVTLSDDTKIKFWRVYCRELDQKLLPDRLGQARSLLKQRATLPEHKDTQIIEQNRTLANSPQPSTLQRPPTPASAQSSMRTWLKSKTSSSQTLDTPRQSGVKLSGASGNSGLDMSAGSVKVSAHSRGESGTVKDSPVQSSSPSDQAPAPSSTSVERKASYSVEKQSPHCAALALLQCSNSEQKRGTELASPQPCSSAESLGSSCEHLESPASDNYSSSPSQAFSSPTKNKACVSSPRPPKSKGWVSNQNVSPKKLKRKPTSTDSPVGSPKRQCLANIESNLQTGDACTVKMNLFPRSDETKVSVNSDISLSGDIAKPVSPHSNHNVVGAALCPSDSSCSQEASSEVSQDSDEVDSPTLNLPNLVLDQARGIGAARMLVKRDASPKPDWLTQFRLQKQKKLSDSKQTTMVSPTINTSWKTIKSYFKPKDQ